MSQTPSPQTMFWVPASLKTEPAFYVGCVALYDRLKMKQESIAFPDPTALDQMTLRFEGLYDVSLSFHLSDRVVGNDLDADQRSLLIVTCANSQRSSGAWASPS